jgi:serine/threonine protein phosphatase PrpC/CRP-like cAMP-binding protein
MVSSPTVPEIDRLSAWAQTNVGRVRDHNEDAFLVDEQLGLFAVADGMGGHAAGEVASKLALETVHRVVSAGLGRIRAVSNDEASREARRDVLRLLEEAAQAACAAVHEAGTADEQKRGMGTTLCALVTTQGHGFIVHVGDSRVYLVRGDKTHQLTQDHSLQNELLKRGKLTPDQIAQVKQKNALTRAIGVYASVDVDTLDFDILPGDRLLLCSDGLYSYLRKGELNSIFEGAPDQAAQRLITLANQRGGHDNITAVVLATGDADPSEKDRLAKLKLETLQNTHLFRFLNYQELVKVGNLTDVRHFVVEEPVFREGEVGDELFVVLSGSVRVHKGGTTILYLRQGEHFGEMALIDREPRSADVTAVEDTRVLVMKRPDFLYLIKHERDMAVKLLWQFLGVLSTRLRHTSRELGEARGQLAAGSEEMLQLGDEDLEEAL